LHQYQKLNIGILLGLLAALPAEKYNHNDFGFGILGNAENGCAAGLAMQNAEKFTVETETAVPQSERSLLDRLFGRNKTRMVTETLPVSDPWNWAYSVFGRETWRTVFDPYAFNDDGIGPRQVTKDQVVARLTALAA
jgi:hypothetical protein